MQNSVHSTANGTNNQPDQEPMHVGTANRRIAVRRWGGAGPDVLLIHGIGSSGASWNALIEKLQTIVSPVTIDLRGHGDSSKPAHGYLYDNYIDDLDRVLDALGMRHPILIGHSLGGIVALWWASRHPARARAIVAVDSPLRSGEDFRPAFDSWIAQNAMTVNDLTAWYLEKNPGWEEDLARHRARIMTGTAPAVFSELKADSMAHDSQDRIAELTAIESPILLIHGDPETGSMVHPDDRRALVERLPNAHLAHIAEAGHALHREHPEAFLAAVTDFLREWALSQPANHG